MKAYDSDKDTQIKAAIEKKQVCVYACVYVCISKEKQIKAAQRTRYVCMCMCVCMNVYVYVS